MTIASRTPDPDCSLDFETRMQVLTAMSDAQCREFVALACGYDPNMFCMLVGVGMGHAASYARYVAEKEAA